MQPVKANFGCHIDARAESEPQLRNCIHGVGLWMWEATSTQDFLRCSDEKTKGTVSVSLFKSGLGQADLGMGPVP